MKGLLRRSGVAAARFMICAALLCTGTAVAGQARLQEIQAQPLSYLHNGQVRGCGLRLTGGEAARPTSSWFDVSFNVFERGVGLAQSIAYELTGSGMEGSSRPQRVPMRRTWVKVADGLPRVGENVARSDTLVYRLLVDDVLELFEAVAHAEPITVGIQKWGQTEDAVFTGVPVLSETSRQSMSRCLAALSL